MTHVWNFVAATPAERLQFCDLATALELPFQLALPRNRLREVRRLQLDASTYYLKLFHRTQWKNRLKFCYTRPRARFDANREAAIADALRAAGIGTARTIAVGHEGQRSVYLCAAISGYSLRELLERGPPPAGLSAQVARLCARLAQAQIILPDISLDHVFCSGIGEDRQLLVIDLHNGIQRRAHRRDAIRWLRRFAHSARGLTITRSTALGFAVRLLRGLGHHRTCRRMISQQSPFDTHTRYDQARSARYATRAPDRHAAELAVLAKLWPGRPGETVLDAPAGAGRLADFVRQRGGRWLGADRARAMLAHARVHGSCLAQAEITCLPFADRSVDGVVVFRFLHHLQPQLAEMALQEVTRAARRFVVVSFFHPVSLHSLRRRIHGWLGRARTRHTVTLAQLRKMMARNGFELIGHGAQWRYVRDFWLASFVRRGSR